MYYDYKIYNSHQSHLGFTMLDIAFRPVLLWHHTTLYLTHYGSFYKWKQLTYEWIHCRCLVAVLKNCDFYLIQFKNLNFRFHGLLHDRLRCWRFDFRRIHWNLTVLENIFQTTAFQTLFKNGFFFIVSFNLRSFENCIFSCHFLWR